MFAYREPMDPTGDFCSIITRVKFYLTRDEQPPWRSEMVEMKAIALAARAFMYIMSVARGGKL